MPASTSGRNSAMKAVEWQPGLAMRLAFFNASRWPGASSGMPNTQPGATRCAVLASMTQVLGLVTSATASLAAASGRHKNATSAALSSRARSAASLRLSASIFSSSMSLRAARYSWMRRPVVPSWPSTKTVCVFMAARISQ